MSQSADLTFPVGDFDSEIRNSETVKIENQDLKSESRQKVQKSTIRRKFAYIDDNTNIYGPRNRYI